MSLCAVKRLGVLFLLQCCKMCSCSFCTNVHIITQSARVSLMNNFKIKYNKKCINRSCVTERFRENHNTFENWLWLCNVSEWIQWERGEKERLKEWIFISKLKATEPMHELRSNLYHSNEGTEEQQNLPNRRRECHLRAMRQKMAQSRFFYPFPFISNKICDYTPLLVYRC